jgi:type III pantothenate kinase
MILEVDIGNTRIKWRLRSEKNVIVLSENGYTSDDLDNIFNLKDIEGFRPTSVWVSTVVPSIEQKFSQWSRYRLGIQPQYALVTREEAGVVNGYDVFSQMGVDRWLAILAAFQVIKGPCIVVDCGTACTVDIIAAGGRHMGGYIVPGLRMMSDALFRDAEGVTSSTIDYLIPPTFGKSTNTAVSSGLPAMIIGLIEYTLSDHLLSGGKIPLLLTGGDGKKFQQVLTNRLGLRVDFNAELVLDGLRYACLTEKYPD